MRAINLCPECGCRMRIIRTIRRGGRGERVRKYRCPKCGVEQRTVERVVAVGRTGQEPPGGLGTTSPNFHDCPRFHQE